MGNRQVRVTAQEFHDVTKCKPFCELFFFPSAP